jgi:hypothetical protein
MTVTSTLSHPALRVYGSIGPVFYTFKVAFTGSPEITLLFCEVFSDSFYKGSA